MFLRLMLIFVVITNLSSVYGDTSDETLNRAKVIYEKKMSDARKHLITAYDEAIRKYTGRGDTRKANQLRGEKKAFIARGVIPKSGSVQELEKSLDATFVVFGKGFEIENFGNGLKAFSNRNYVLADIPRKFAGWRFTQKNGGAFADMNVNVTSDGFIYASIQVDTVKEAGKKMTGWILDKESFFSYTSEKKERMVIVKRWFKAGDAFKVDQLGWTGTLLLIPPAE